MNQRVIDLMPYDPTWAEAFAAEQQLLQQTLGAVAVVIHHIGSTAVPGLAAKAIIDILLEVPSLAALDNAADKMQLLGYCAKGENGIAGRRYFYKNGRQNGHNNLQRSHHLHAFITGDPHLNRHLAFRDYLINRPLIAVEYQALKFAAAARSKDQHNSSVFYTGLKSSFIEYHTNLALQCYQAE